MCELCDVLTKNSFSYTCFDLFLTTKNVNQTN